jgi:hypothetical protein
VIPEESAPRETAGNGKLDAFLPSIRIFSSAARLGQVRRPPDHTGTKRGAPSGLPRTLLSDLAISVFAAVEYAVFVPRPSGSSGGKIGTSLNTYSVCVGHTAEVLAADDLLGRGYTLTRPLTIGLLASSVSYDVRAAAVWG